MLQNKKVTTADITCNMWSQLIDNSSLIKLYGVFHLISFTVAILRLNFEFDPPKKQKQKQKTNKQKQNSAISSIIWGNFGINLKVNRQP